MSHRRKQLLRRSCTPWGRYTLRNQIHRSFHMHLRTSKIRHRSLLLNRSCKQKRQCSQSKCKSCRRSRRPHRSCTLQNPYIPMCRLRHIHRTRRCTSTNRRRKQHQPRSCRQFHPCIRGKCKTHRRSLLLHRNCRPLGPCNRGFHRLHKAHIRRAFDIHRWQGRCSCMLWYRCSCRRRHKSNHHPH